MQRKSVGNFWETKPLTELTDQQWEALCDGCGRCCLNKLEVEETGVVFYTRAACRLLEISTCRCKNYANRLMEVPGCMGLREAFTQFHWLPETCAYRLRNQGQMLPPWHPLNSGRDDTVHEVGISVRSFAISELEVDDLEDHLMDDF